MDVAVGSRNETIVIVEILDGKMSARKQKKRRDQTGWLTFISM